LIKLIKNSQPFGENVRKPQGGEIFFDSLCSVEAASGQMSIPRLMAVYVVTWLREHCLVND